MPLRIPDSGQITSDNAVLRQPSTVEPQRNLKVDTIDLTPALDSIQNVGNAYLQQKEAVDNALTQQVANDFDEHMAAFQTDLFNSRKGYAAKDIYKAMKDESYKYYNNLTGDPKDDGKVRIASADAKAKLLNYVNSRQRAFISQSASYEASEIQSAQKATFEAGLVNASNHIITSKTNQEIADGMAEIARINSIQLRGYPADYVRLETAKLQDAAAAGYITQRISVNPIEALYQMNTNPNVSDYLTSSSRAKLTTAIQDAYRAREVSRAMNNDVDELTVPMIKQIYNVQNDAEAEYIRNSIINEAREKKTVQDQKAADTFAAMGSDLVNRALAAETPEERFKAEASLAEFAPQLYQTYSDMNASIAEMETAKRIIEQNDIVFPELPSAVSGSSESIALARRMREAIDRGEVDPNDPQVQQYINRSNYAEVDNFDMAMGANTEYQLKMQALPVEQRQIVEKYFNNINGRFADRSARMDVYTKIANGEQNIERLGLNRFDGETQLAMMRAMKGVVEWDSVNAELRQGGVDLEKEINDSQFVELRNNPAKQMVVKQYVVREMQRYKAENKVWPTSDQRQRIINSSISAAMTPADEINNKLQTITAQGIFDRTLMGDTTSYKTKDTTYEKRHDIISEALDTVIDDGSLNQLQRETIRMYREQIIQAAMSGTPLPVLEDILGVY